MKIVTPNFFAISFVNISKSLTTRAVFNRMFKCDNRGRSRYIHDPEIGNSRKSRSQRIQAIRANQEIQQVEYISLFGQ